jgi:hypothetical protein
MVFLVPKYIEGFLISPYKLSMPPNNGATTKHRNKLIFMFKESPQDDDEGFVMNVLTFEGGRLGAKCVFLNQLHWWKLSP